jgi:hypothetical protein
MTTTQQFNFSIALKLLKCGSMMARQGWNGKGMHVQLVLPPPGTPEFLPFLQMKTATGAYVPWVASHSDILAEDWIEVEVEMELELGEAE